MGISNLVTYHELINDFLNPHKEIALPSIEVFGNDDIGESIENIETTKPTSSKFISNMTIFKDGKFLGYLTNNESLAYNIITNNTKTYLIRNKYNNKDFIVNEIIKSSTSIDPNIKKKEITITIKGDASISEVNHKINLENDKNIKKIENKLNNDIEKLIKESITSTNTKYNSDIYGFKDLFYKTNPKQYKKLVKELGDNFLTSLNIKVKSDIRIIEKGNLNGGIYNE
jgi:spore germination protein KC